MSFEYEPRFTEPLKASYVIREGQPVKLSCRFDASPNSSIQWLKDGVEIEFESLGISRDFKVIKEVDYTALLIKEAFPEDTGSYIVVIRNTLGEAHSFTQLTVEEFFCRTPESEMSDTPMKPVFVQPLRDTSINEGQQLKLHAAINAHPEPEIIWYRNNIPLKNSRGLTVTYDGQLCTLIKDRCEKENDTGIYRITAVNSMGQAECICQVIVQAKDTQGFREHLQANRSLPIANQSLQTKTTYEENNRHLQSNIMEQTNETQGFHEHLQSNRPIPTINQSLQEENNRHLQSNFIEQSNETQGFHEQRQPNQSSQNKITYEDNNRHLQSNFIEQSNETQGFRGQLQSNRSLTNVNQSLQEENNRHLQSNFMEQSNATQGFHEQLQANRSLPIVIQPPQTRIPHEENNYHIQSSDIQGFREHLQANRSLPNVNQSLLNRIIQEDNNRHLQSNSNEQSKSQVIYYKDNQSLNNAYEHQIRTERMNHTLEIPKISRNNANFYQRKASSRSGERKHAAMPHVLPSTTTHEPMIVAPTGFPPEFLQVFHDKKTSLGSTIRFEARLTGTPPLNVYWLFQGMPISNLGTNKHYQQNNDNDTYILTINNIRYDDVGKYTLNAENSWGKTTCTAELFVVPTTVRFGKIISNITFIGTNTHFILPNARLCLII
ncbi:unnamed protein product [Adineta steineri]|uniref:Ig-like domain-containing protein n=1 Tax=Adineta steineri TaxID=433720 RepID=A0A814R134_9BILA|nr:unnamed protein product [Adineta steineri]